MDMLIGDFDNVAIGLQTISLFQFYFIKLNLLKYHFNLLFSSTRSSCLF